MVYFVPYNFNQIFKKFSLKTFLFLLLNHNWKCFATWGNVEAPSSISVWKQISLPHMANTCSPSLHTILKDVELHHKKSVFSWVMSYSKTNYHAVPCAKSNLSPSPALALFLWRYKIWMHSNLVSVKKVHIVGKRLLSRLYQTVYSIKFMKVFKCTVYWETQYMKDKKM